MSKALLLALVAGCSSTTEVLVTVDTQGLRIGKDIDSLHFAVTDVSPGVDVPLQYDHTFLLCADGVAGSCQGLPLTAELHPGSARPGDQVRVLVEGMLARNPVISDAATFRFTGGQRQRLSIVLYANCLGRVDCSQKDQVCDVTGQCSTVMPVGSDADLAAPPPPDLSTVQDFSHGFDLASADFSTAPDLAPPIDLAGADFALRPVTQLVYSMQPAATEHVVTPFAVQITLADATGAVVPLDGVPVSVAFMANPTAATLGGTLTQPTVAGVARFGDLHVDKPGMAYTLIASAPTATSATAISLRFNVTLPWAFSNNGLPRGAVSGLAVDSNNANHVYAATSAGLYVSSDGASTWQLQPGPLPDPMSFVFLQPSSANVVDVGGPLGAWHSGDGGLTAGQVFAANANALGYDNSNGQHWMATTSNNNVYLSSNGVTAYAPAGTGLPDDTWKSIFVASSSTVFVGSASGVYTRAPGATMFGAGPTGIPAGATVTALVGDGANDVWAGTSTGFIYKNANATSTFNPMNTTSLGTITSLVLHTSLYATVGGTGGGLYNFNGSWVSVGPNVDARSVGFIDASNVYLGTASGEGVMKGPLNGTFVGMSIGLNNIDVRSIAYDNVGNVYAVAQNQVCSSSDGGATWSVTMKGLTSTPSAIMFDFAHGVLYALGIDSVWKLASGTWSQVGPSLPASPNGLAVDRITATTLYAATSPNYGVLKYTVASNMWTASNSGLPGTSVSVIASAPGGNLWAGVDNGGLYYSASNGASWLKLGGFPATVSFSAIVPDFSNGQILYVADSGGLHVTVNGGIAWSNPLGTSTVAALALDPANPSILYAVAGNGVFQSSDGAASFHPAFGGFNALYGTSVGLQATADANVIVGSQITGIARSTSMGL